MLIRTTSQSAHKIATVTLHEFLKDSYKNLPVNVGNFYSLLQGTTQVHSLKSSLVKGMVLLVEATRLM